MTAKKEVPASSRGTPVRPKLAQSGSEVTKAKIDATRLKRERREAPEPTPTTMPVSAGPIDRVIELAFNPSREKIREVTIIDRIQGRLFPLLDMIIAGRNYILEVAAFREDAVAYKKEFKKERPVPIDLLDEFLYRTAQWQKSIQGKNLERATDIALAETEIRGGDEGDGASGTDAWKE